MGMSNVYYDYIGYVLYVGLYYWYQVGFCLIFLVWGVVGVGVWYLHSKRYPGLWVSRQALLSRLLG